jgi:Protein of unknown function (DUF4239)
MMYWIYDYPRWAIAILFVAVFAGVTWIGIFLTRATVHSWIHSEKRANEMVGFTLSSFFVLFGLLLGLVAVATYQNYSNVTDTVDKEASSIAALDRDLNGFPQPVRSQLKDRLAEYARFTNQEGWPQQRKGIIPSGGTERISSLFQVLLAFEPAKKSEEIFFAEALREFDRLIEVRRMRLANVLVGLPTVIWWVVAFGAALNIILIWLQDMEIHVHDPRRHPCVYSWRRDFSHCDARQSISRRNWFWPGFNRLGVRAIDETR